jgi:peroxiredoxin Q/BCP
MVQIAAGDAIPDIELKTHSGDVIRLTQYCRDHPVVLFFYPKDGSPVCTREACAFRDAYDQFLEVGAKVIGVSADDNSRHEQFATQHRLPFPLVSDTRGEAREAFGVGKSWGLLPGRVTFVIDTTGTVRHVFSAQFAADRHVQEALDIIRQMQDG